jgi:hypothetical protein
MIKSLEMGLDTMMPPNKSLQATRDGRSISAIAENVISPTCLSSGR